MRKELEQWFFKITEFAERLLKNLDTLDWSEKVKIAQRNWIGKSEGALVDFNLIVPGQPDGKYEVQIFTTRPDTMFGATFMAVSPELAQKWIDAGWAASDGVKQYIKKALASRKKIDEEKSGEKTGVASGVCAINPANKERIPVWIADYVLGDVGTGAIMAVPAHDERDCDFAKKYNLPIVFVITPPVTIDGKSEKKSYVGDGHLQNSGKFDDMDSETAKWEITKLVGGKRTTQYRLRDWLISRQRYWGPPIPMVYCDACAKQGKGERKEMPGWYAALEKDLPVKLPYVKDFQPRGTGASPLATVREFYETKCPGCGGTARRETDVSDTFLDSAWYYLRYLDPQNAEEALNKERIAKWLPAEKSEATRLYTGGAEHAVLHLLYVRFLAMALHDQGFVASEEPFKKFRAHGLLIKEGAKMSKSKGNVVNPDEYVKKFGADTLRMYLMFLAPFEDGGDFRDSSILGTERFLARVWKYAEELGNVSVTGRKTTAATALLHKTIKKVGEDIERLHYNTAVSALMILLRALEDEKGTKEDFEIFLKLLAPFAPHLTEEIWRETLGHAVSIHREQWPNYNSALITEEKFTLVFQVNGKMRDTASVDVTINEAAAKELALQNQKVKNAIGGKTPKKVIYVDKKLVNIVS